ncbi:MAG: hypothetical protein AAGN15_10485 [Cyanobacteria bacterium J06581_3]
MQSGDNTIGQEVRTLIFGGIIGAFLKHSFEEWSARNQARRELVKSVTTNIEGLAKQYYWSLANLAGTLATLLQNHLEKLEQLQLSQGKPEDLKKEQDSLIQQTAEESIGYYAHFTKLTYDFDLNAGNTFFLRDYWAGRSIRDLQNGIRRIFIDIDDSDIIRVMNEISAAENSKPPSPSKQNGAADNQTDSAQKGEDQQDSQQDNGQPNKSEKVHTPADLGKKLLSEVQPIHKNYIAFLEDKTRVYKACQYLNAYHELFRDELKILYKDWFRESWLRPNNIRTKPPSRRKLRALNTSAQRTILHLARRRRRYGEMVPIGGLGTRDSVGPGGSPGSNSGRKPGSTSGQSPSASARPQSKMKDSARTEPDTNASPQTGSDKTGSGKSEGMLTSDGAGQ